MKIGRPWDSADADAGYAAAGATKSKTVKPSATATMKPLDRPTVEFVGTMAPETEVAPDGNRAFDGAAAALRHIMLEHRKL